ncbi:hypothetical protein OFN32_30440, partial [Escherichia coli]|nr:hypothetical protein [Escherichia coli]
DCFGLKLFNTAVAIPSSHGSYGLVIMVQMSSNFNQSKKTGKEKGELFARLSYLFINFVYASIDEHRFTYCKSKRSAFMTFVHAAMKSWMNFS